MYICMCYVCIQWQGQTLRQMLTSCTDKKGNSTHATKIVLDLQGQEWQPNGLEGIVYTGLSFLHTQPLIYLQTAGRGLTKPLLNHSEILKASQWKEGGNPSCKRWIWATLRELQQCLSFKGWLIADGMC